MISDVKHFTASSNGMAVTLDSKSGIFSKALLNILKPQLNIK